MRTTGEGFGLSGPLIQDSGWHVSLVLPRVSGTVVVPILRPIARTHGSLHSRPGHAMSRFSILRQIERLDPVRDVLYSLEKATRLLLRAAEARSGEKRRSGPWPVAGVGGPVADPDVDVFWRAHLLLS